VLLQVPLFLIASQVQDWSLFIAAIASFCWFRRIPFTTANDREVTSTTANAHASPGAARDLLRSASDRRGAASSRR